jgi:hypothetical protein
MPSPVRARQSYRHEAFLWHGRDQFVQRLAPFIREGIEAGEAMMVAVTPEHAAWLTGELGPSARQVRFVDMTELGRNPACIIPAWQSFLDECAGDGRPARGIGEPIWVGRRPEEIAECQLHESLLNLAIDPDLPFWLVCPYDDARLDPEVITEAGRSHPVLATSTSYSGSPNYQGHLHARALFTGELPALTGSPVQMRVSRPPNLPALTGCVTLQAATADVWSDEVVSLACAVRELTGSSLRRNASSVQLRFWNEPEVLICDVMDDSVIDDLLIGRRSTAADHDAFWFANQACPLVQVRSSEKGTIVRIHVRK